MLTLFYCSQRLHYLHCLYCLQCLNIFWAKRLLCIYTIWLSCYMAFRAKCWLEGWWSEVGDIPETVMTTRAPAMLKINQNSLQRGRSGHFWLKYFSEMIPKRIIFPFRHPEDWGQANKWEKWWKHPPGSSIIWNPPLETVKTYFWDFVWRN